MKKIFKFTCMFLCLLFLGIVLTACGGGGGGGSTGGGGFAYFSPTNTSDNTSNNTGSNNVNNTGNSGDNTGNSGDNTGNSGDNTGNSGDNTGNSGDNTGNSGDNTGNSEDNTGNSGDNTGNSGDNTGNSGDNTGNSGDNTGNSGDNTGNSGDNTGNSGDNTGNTGDNTGNTPPNPFANANVGDIVSMGTYPYTKEGEVQTIKWKVLYKDEINNRLLVISRSIIDQHIFDSSSNIWSNSSIRTWLNADFYNTSFSNTEKIYITTDISTKDNIFLLSNAEAEAYLPGDTAKLCIPTPYALSKGVYTASSYGNWWLRSNSSNSNQACYVYHGGKILDLKVNDTRIGVRPAMWIKLNTENSGDNTGNSGDDTEINPFANANIGDYVSMGTYPYTKEGEVQTIKWYVLYKDENNNRLLVISRSIIDQHIFDSSSNFWMISSIRTWLNADFYNTAFSNTEKRYIVSTELTDVGSIDHVFLLDYTEAEAYLLGDTAKLCIPTPYALSKGVYTASSYGNWWLRSAYPKSNNVHYVYHGGKVLGNLNVNDTRIGVRPAMWVNI